MGEMRLITIEYFTFIYAVLVYGQFFLQSSILV